jgi:hypothetical protein
MASEESSQRARAPDTGTATAALAPVLLGHALTRVVKNKTPMRWFRIQAAIGPEPIAMFAVERCRERPARPLARPRILDRFSGCSRAGPGDCKGCVRRSMDANGLRDSRAAAATDPRPSASLELVANPREPRVNPCTERGVQVLAVGTLAAWPEICCSRLIMKSRHLVTALIIAVLLTPVLLSVGVFILIPFGLVVLAVLPIACVATLPVLFALAARDAEPADARADLPVSSRVVYTR